MTQENNTESKDDRFVAYNLKAKSVVFDTIKGEPLLESESKEDLIISMLVDLKNSVTKLEKKLI